MAGASRMWSSVPSARAARAYARIWDGGILSPPPPAAPRPALFHDRQFHVALLEAGAPLRTRSRKTPVVLVTAALATGPPSPFFGKNVTAPARRLAPPATSGPCRSSNESGITRGCARRTGFGRRRGTRPIGDSRGGRGPVARGVAGESHHLDHRARPRGRPRALAESVNGCRHALVISRSRPPGRGPRGPAT
jgi:hypothetical protein